MWSTFSIFGALFCIALASNRVETVALFLSAPHSPNRRQNPLQNALLNGQEKHPRTAYRPRQAVTGASHPLPSPRTLWAQSEQVTGVSATSPRLEPPQAPDNSGEPPRPPGPSEQRGSSSPRTHFPSSKLRPWRGRGRGGRPRQSRAVGLDAAGPGPGRGCAGRRAGAARGSGRGRGGTSYSSSEAMVGGGVAGGREGQGRGEAPPPPGGRHFVSVGSLRGLRFLLPLPAPGAKHGRASHTHCQCGPAAAAAAGLCAGAAAQRALRAPRSLPGGPARARAHRAPPRGRAGLGRARRRCTAARLAPWLPLSGVVQKASYLRPKNLPRLLSMPSAAARARRRRAPALRVFGQPAREGRGGRRGGAAEGSSGLRSGPRRAGCRRELPGRKGRSQGAVGGAETRRGRGHGNGGRGLDFCKSPPGGPTRGRPARRPAST